MISINVNINENQKMKTNIYVKKSVMKVMAPENGQYQLLNNIENHRKLIGNGC